MERTEESFANVLRYLITLHQDDLSQEQIAEKVGISKNTLSNWVRGRSNPSRKEDVVKLAEVLDMTPFETDYLLHRAGFKPITTPIETLNDYQLLSKKADQPTTAVSVDTVRSEATVIAPPQRARFNSTWVLLGLVICVVLGGIWVVLNSDKQPAGSADPLRSMQTTTETPSSANVATPQSTVAGQQIDCSELIEETIPDNTVLLPNTAYTKTWTLHNCGVSTWNNSDFHLVFSSMQPRTDWQPPQHLVVPEIPPGGTSIVEMEFVTPTATATYTVVYELHGPRGEVKPRIGILRPFIVFVIK